MAENKNTFHLIVASFGETLFDGAAISATLPTTAGEITVLPHHEALITTLKAGTITAKVSEGEQKTFAVTGGVLECSNNRVVVLL